MTGSPTARAGGGHASGLSLPTARALLAQVSPGPTQVRPPHPTLCQRCPSVPQSACVALQRVAVRVARVV